MFNISYSNSGWMLALVAICCLTQCLRDLREKQLRWAIAAAIAMMLTLCVPLPPTHAVKLDLVRKS